MPTNRVTDYLKGIAIIAVIADHFSLHYANKYYYPYLGGYAAGLLVIFFIFSGYGNFLSLERRWQDGGVRSWKACWRFLAARALKIYPLFWIALLTVYYLQPNFGELRLPGGFIYFLALPYPRPPRLFWFVTQIVECYLAAPFIFLALRRLGVKIFLALVAGVSVAMVPVSIVATGGYSGDITSPLWSFAYRYLFLANLILFALGMATVVILHGHPIRFKPWPYLVASAAVMAIGIHYTRLWSQMFDRSMCVFALPLVWGAFIFCLAALSWRPRLPLAGLMTLAGRHSYPLYLFHLCFFGALVEVGFLQANDWFSGSITVALLLPFLFACVALQKGYDYVLVQGRQNLLPGPRIAVPKKVTSLEEGVE